MNWSRRSIGLQPQLWQPEEASPLLEQFHLIVNDLCSETSEQATLMLENRHGSVNLLDDRVSYGDYPTTRPL